MEGIRFYLEFPSSTAKKRSGKTNIGHSGNVYAAYIDNTFLNVRGVCMVEGLGGLWDEPNSVVAGTSAAHDEFLRHQCKRIPERLARQIHPRLFERLDAK